MGSRHTRLRLGPRGALTVLVPMAAAVIALGAPTAEAVPPPMRGASLDRPDLAMIVTGDSAPEKEDDDIRWHRAPRAVFDQLDRAGLMGGAVEGQRGAGAGAEGGDGPGGLGHGAWWAVPGLAVGFAVGAGGTRLIRRAAARPGAGPPQEEPRQELIDL